MTMRIGGNNRENSYGSNIAESASVKTSNAAPAGAPVQTQSQKLPAIENEATFKVTNCKTERELARAGLMAAASRAGIASAPDQAAFADRMLAKKDYDLKNITANTEIADQDVRGMNGKQYTYVLNKFEKTELAAFRNEYVAAGKKLVYAKNPTINARAASANQVATPNAPRNIRVKITLPKTNEPLADRALLGFAQQKYGQPATNLWGDNLKNIRDVSKLQGVKPQNIKVSQMGNKTIAEFELSPADAAKVQKNYEAEQTEFNRVQEIADKFRHNNEAVSFLRGFGNGVWSALKNNWEMIKDPIGTAKALFQMVTNPIETLAGIKKLVGDKWTEFQNADPSKRAEMLGNIAGELAVDALLTKGAGKVAKLSKAAEMLKGTKIGESIISKADDAAKAVKAAFSDEAAAAARQRIKQRLATQLYSGIPADVLADMAIVGANKVKNGAVKFAEFSKQMVQEFGEQVRPKLLELYQESIEKVFGKRKDLELDELLGGHTIERHVGKSDSWLRQRLSNEPKTATASSFRNEAVANRTIAQFVKQNRAEIEAWLRSGEHRFEKDIVMDEPIGSVLGRGKGGAPNSKSVETDKARVSIVRDNTPQGWHVQTSFPIMSKGKVEW